MTTSQDHDQDGTETAQSEAATDQTYFWTGRDCPEEDCDGDLQQQDWMNVMCLSCERVWMHSRDSETHKLRTQTFDTVAEEPILATDGGVDQDDGDVDQAEVVNIANCRDCAWFEFCGSDYTKAENMAYDHGDYRQHDVHVLKETLELPRYRSDSE